MFGPVRHTVDLSTPLVRISSSKTLSCCPTYSKDLVEEQVSPIWPELWSKTFVALSPSWESLKEMYNVSRLQACVMIWVMGRGLMYGMDRSSLPFCEY